MATGSSVAADFSVAAGSSTEAGSSVAAGFSVSAGSSTAAGFSKMVCSSEVAATSVAPAVSIWAASGTFSSDAVGSVVKRVSSGDLSSIGAGSLTSADPPLAGKSSIASVLSDAACSSARVVSSDGIDFSVGLCFSDTTPSVSVVIAVSSVVAESLAFAPTSGCRGSSTVGFSIDCCASVTTGGSCGGLAASLLSSDIGAESELGSGIDSVGCGSVSVGVSSTVSSRTVSFASGGSAGAAFSWVSVALASGEASEGGPPLDDGSAAVFSAIESSGASADIVSSVGGLACVLTGGSAAEGSSVGAGSSGEASAGGMLEAEGVSSAGVFSSGGESVTGAAWPFDFLPFLSFLSVLSFLSFLSFFLFVDLILTSMPAGAFTTTLSLIDFPLDFFSGLLSFPLLDFVFGFSSDAGSAGGTGFSSFESSAGASGGEDASTGGRSSGSGTTVVLASSDASAGWSDESCGSCSTSPFAVSSF